MSLFARIRNVVRSNRLSNDLDRELSFHLSERVDELVAQGMSPKAARDEARRRFGNYGIQKEATRDRDTLPWLESLVGDLRYAFRALRASPGFALVAILSLALGIGANTAIFSLINAIMLRSLPVSHPEELVVVLRDGNQELTNPIWEYVRKHQDVFSGVFTYENTSFNLSNGGEARRVPATFVSGAFFTTLGVRSFAGRTLLPSDDRRGCPAVAVISGSFWESAYGGKRDGIGQTISLDGHPFQIVGIIDPGFSGLDVGRHAQVYAPLCTKSIIDGNDAWVDARSNWYLPIVGRVKEGLAPEQVRTRLDMLNPGLIEATLPNDWPAESVSAYKAAKFTIEDAATGFSSLRTSFRRGLFILMAIVGIVLLIACANVANLLLARATSRQRELAVRLALGAGRSRLVRQLLTESILLSMIGAALGVLFAFWGSSLLVRLMSTSTGRLALDLAPDMRVLSFTILVSIATGILFGLAPAWRASRVDPQGVLKSQGRGIVEGRSRLSMGKALVVAQIALSLVLVVGAVLLLGSWHRLATTDLGYKSDQILLTTVDLRSAKLSPEARRIMYRRLLDRLRAIPGVQAVGTAAVTPISGSGWNGRIKADGFSPATQRGDVVWINEVSDGYFAAMGTPLVSGRDFNGGDTPESAPVAIINEAMAERVFGTRNAVGKHFQKRNADAYDPPIAVIGVIANTKYRSIRETAEPIAYLSAGQNASPSSGLTFEIRSAGALAPSALTSSIAAAVKEIDARISIDFLPFEQVVSRSLRLPRTLATLAGFFGGLALLLAMIGLYGIMSYSVARRRNEIGIRIALGAAQERVVRMVVAEVFRLIIAGLVIGSLAAIAGTRLVESFLYGVTPNDPTTILSSAALLLFVGIGAAVAPAVRAARLDPVSALREE